MRLESKLKHLTTFLTVAGIIAVTLSMLAVYSWNTPDDTYISFTYAKNLANGNGFTYNGIRVEGYSNFLWTLLIAGFIYTSIDPLAGARVISILLLFGTVLLAIRLQSYFSPDRKPIDVVLLSLLICTNVSIIAWTQSGLETISLMFLITALAVLESNPKTSLSRRSALVAFACSISRPEGIFVIPAVLAYNLLRLSKPNRKMIRWLLFAGVPLLIYLAWRLHYYGWLLPNSVYSKVNLSSNGFFSGSDYVKAFFILRPTLTILFFLSLAMMAWKRKSLPAGLWVVCLLISIYIGLVLIAGWDYMPYHRYMVPFLALLIFIAYHGVFLGVELKKWKRPLYVFLSIATILIEIGFSVAGYPSENLVRVSNMKTPFAWGEWIKENTSEEDVIAVIDAGVLAYVSERKTIDLMGLNDSYIAHAGKGIDAEYVLSYDPAIIQLHIQWSNEQGRWISPVEETYNPILDHPEFIRCYALVLYDGPVTKLAVYRRIHTPDC